MIQSLTYRLRPFHASDATLLQAQVKQQLEFAVLNDYGIEGWQRIERDSRTWTGFCGDRVLGFAGLIEFWPSRLLGWAILSDTVNRHDMLWIHRAVKQAIDGLPHKVRRVEITVHSEFAQAHRWAQMLGFKRECEMEAYDPMGNTHTMYSRIRG